MIPEVYPRVIENVLLPLVGGLAGILFAILCLWWTRPKGKDFFRETAPWILAVRLVAVIVFAAASFILFGPLGIFVLFIAISLMYTGTSRSFWLTFSSAVRNNLPLLPTLSAYLKDQGALEPHPSLLRSLAAGQPVEKVLRRFRVKLRDRVAVYLGALTGAWDDAIDVADENELALRDAEELFYGRFGLVLAATAALFGALFILGRVMRMLVFIAEDFGLGELITTHPVLSMMAIVAKTVPNSPLFLLGLMLLVIILTGFYWTGGLNVLRDLFPFTECSSHVRSLILQGLALGTRAEKTYPAILEALIHVFAPRFWEGITASVPLGISWRLWGVHDAIRRGDDLADALLRWRLIRPPDAEVLRAAESMGNLPEALETLAVWYRDRAASRLRWWGIYGYLIIVAVVAILVAAVYLGCFVFLVQLAYSLL
ncbi:MAG: type II secretion system F family protein [Thermogutta sp.]|uniref:type II secretion system F family protein n=1 Tax=Thermogutta sp. TaxID=1962930 RepID=UPI0019CB45FD|nr:type II secretion system F family protein [Thermogutta sp.]MBC7351556.1 type II secretion system F family protein [Thermogutta sp.]